MTAIKIESKNGTSKGAADFIPAIMITSVALTISARDVGENDLVTMFP